MMNKETQLLFMAVGHMRHKLEAELTADKYNGGRGCLKQDITDYKALEAKLQAELLEQAASDGAKRRGCQMNDSPLVGDCVKRD